MSICLGDVNFDYVEMVHYLFTRESLFFTLQLLSNLWGFLEDHANILLPIKITPHSASIGDSILGQSLGLKLIQLQFPSMFATLYLALYYKQEPSYPLSIYPPIVSMNACIAVLWLVYNSSLYSVMLALTLHPFWLVAPPSAWPAIFKITPFASGTTEYYRLI